MLAARGMTLTQLSERAGVSIVNLSVLKNNRARAVRFSTLTAVCDALGCDVADVLRLSRPPEAIDRHRSATDSPRSGADASRHGGPMSGSPGASDTSEYRVSGVLLQTETNLPM
ncbi:MAG TPA: helix-turn-helix domain-containing protein [Jatrophihabitans sp.]|jgi:putative transcriptional regulator